MTTAIRPIPTSYPGHPHATEEYRRIASDGLILRVEVGSTAHGIAVAGTDDRDEMGLCIEPPAFVTGLQQFEQFQRHTAWDRGGVHTPSGAGDLDVVVYSLRKWSKLALAGNPSVLMLLFAPPASIVDLEPAGAELFQAAHRFLSRQAAGRFLGYLHRQKLGMTGEAGAKVKRPALVAEHGYDTKYAAHAIRLGLQGIELMNHGHVTLPMPEPYRQRLIEVRQGHLPLNAVVAWVEQLERRLRIAAEDSHLPEQPNREWVDRWLHRTYTRHWTERHLS